MQAQTRYPHDTNRIVRKSFLRLLPIQIIGILVTAINTLIDSILTGQFLGTEAVAAIGFFGPVATIIGISYVVVTGIQVLCSKHMGSGDSDQLVAEFSTGMVFLACFCALLSMICILFRHPLAGLLGATGSTRALLEDYMLGYAFGIIGEVLSGLLMVFLPFNNDEKRTYLGIGVMVLSNTAFDLLFTLVFHLGVLGMGLATALSNLLTFFVMLPGVLGQEKAIRLELHDLRFSHLPEAIRLGLPSLMFTLGCTAKSYIMNLTLMSSVGNAAVAAMNVQGNLCAFLGAIPQGCANTFLTLGSLYYGEEDRTSLTVLMRLALRLGTLLSAILMGILMASSGILPGLFFPDDGEAWHVTRQMLLLFPSFLVLNTIMNLFLKVYQCQGRMLLVNILSVAENLLMALLAVCLTPLLSSDAVWLSFPLSEIVCLFVIAISVFVHHGRMTHAITDWMKLPDTFGAGDKDYLTFSVHSMDEVVTVSQTIIRFCKEHAMDPRKANIAGLAIEEMAGNIVQHGFSDHKKHAVDIRVVAKDPMTIRLRDDCPAFDLKQYLTQFKVQEDITKNVGIRMIASLSADMQYQYSTGINTVLMKIA